MNLLNLFALLLGGATPPAQPESITRKGTVENRSGSHASSAADIGVAASNRYIYVAVIHKNSPACTVEINGVEMSQLEAITQGGTVRIFRLKKTNGSTADIEVTCSDDFAYAWWVAYHSSGNGTARDVSDSNGTSLDQSIDTTDGEFLIGAFWDRAGGTGHTWTWGGSDSITYTNLSVQAGQRTASIAEMTITEAVTQTLTVANNTAGDRLALVTYEIE